MPDRNATPNIYEIDARQAKVTALVRFLAAKQITAGTAEELDGVSWHNIAIACGVNPPSIATVRAVVAALPESYGPLTEDEHAAAGERRWEAEAAR